MATFVAAQTSPLAIAPRAAFSAGHPQTVAVKNGGKVFSELRHVPGAPFSKSSAQISSSSSSRSRRFRTAISCSANPETLQVVQSTIAKQLSVDVSSVAPETKFADLGADSLDTVEIMMALEEQFEVSIGEGGAENIATVQDAADLIEKVKAASA